MNEQTLIFLSAWFGFWITVLFYIQWVSENRRIIGDQYLTRFFLIPHNKIFNIYLHKYTGSDSDVAMHDHPWSSVSFLLRGDIQEHTIQWTPESMYCIKPIWRFIPKYRHPQYTHRLELISKTAWTLFFTGRTVREWGFACPKGWVHWKQFTDESGNQIGRGCD